MAISTLASKPLSEFALMHRKMIDDVRSVSFVKNYNGWVKKIGGNALPARRWGADSWIFSNQVIAGLADIEFGPESKVEAFWHWNTPIIPDHSVLLNKFKGGYILEAGIRRTRWKAVEQQLWQMKDEGPM